MYILEGRMKNSYDDVMSAVEDFFLPMRSKHDNVKQISLYNKTN